jgi:hypothetical protein
MPRIEINNPGPGTTSRSSKLGCDGNRDKMGHATRMTCDDSDEARAIDAGGDLLGGGRRREPRGAPPLRQAQHTVAPGADGGAMCADLESSSRHCSGADRHFVGRRHSYFQLEVGIGAVLVNLFLFL